MMAKGFLTKKFTVWMMLLALVAGASSPLVAAEIRDIRIAATDSGTRVVLELSAAAKYKAFQLDDPDRIVLDLVKSSLEVPLPAASAPFTEIRSGDLPNEGLRLVFEIKGPVTIATSTLPATRDSAARLILDINAPGGAKAVAGTR